MGVKGSRVFGWGECRLFGWCSPKNFFGLGVLLWFMVVVLYILICVGYSFIGCTRVLFTMRIGRNDNRGEDYG